MDFVANRQQQIEEMLSSIGLRSIEELFDAVPESLMLPRPEKDDGLSEFEGFERIEEIGRQNTFPAFDNYLGGGSYEHHVPALVGAVCGKSEFLTSYTPYQAEMSQGMLQAIFEFQSSVCALTGMDVSNASVYDAASAAAEAALMSLRHQKGRSTILMADTVHPHCRSTVRLYTEGAGAKIERVKADSKGQIDLNSLKRLLSEDVASVIIQSPNFLGAIEEVLSFIELIRECGALVILMANPLSYGIYASAGELGVDIAAGDMQPFGLPMQFGGPYAGYLACRQTLLRQLPGRIVGETVDTEGARGFVLTLQAREQHIRRDKATSNICTNQALAALACLVGALWYGKEGVKQLATTNYRRAHYLKSKLDELPGVKTLPSPIFNEFCAYFGAPYNAVRTAFEKAGIQPGIHLGSYLPGYEDYVLIAVTETKNQEQLDRYLSVAEGIA